MSAIREVRPVVTGVPGLKLVPTPAPARGFFGTVIACVSLFVGTFGAVFFLNTQMVSTAYELQSVRKELSVATAREATLENDVISASTPQHLRAKAEALGLTSAASVQHLDLATGTIVSPAVHK